VARPPGQRLNQIEDLSSVTPVHPDSTKPPRKFWPKRTIFYKRRSGRSGSSCSGQNINCPKTSPSSDDHWHDRRCVNERIRNNSRILYLPGEMCCIILLQL